MNKVRCFSHRDAKEMAKRLIDCGWCSVSIHQNFEDSEWPFYVEYIGNLKVFKI